jgi:hypothetical protein
MKTDIYYTDFDGYDLQNFEGWGQKFEIAAYRIDDLYDSGIEDIYDTLAAYIRDNTSNYDNTIARDINDIICYDDNFEKLITLIEEDLYNKIENEEEREIYSMNIYTQMSKELTANNLENEE